MFSFDFLRYGKCEYKISNTLLLSFRYSMKALGGRGGAFDFIISSSTFLGDVWPPCCGVLCLRFRVNGTGRTIPTLVPGGILSRINSCLV